MNNVRLREICFIIHCSPKMVTWPVSLHFIFEIEWRQRGILACRGDRRGTGACGAVGSSYFLDEVADEQVHVDAGVNVAAPAVVGRSSCARRLFWQIFEWNYYIERLFTNESSGSV